MFQSWQISLRMKLACIFIVFFQQCSQNIQQDKIITYSSMINDHSTNPDIITGWQPRDLTPQLKQFPLIFVNNSVDLLSKSLTSFGNQHRYRVVYMGPRYASNMKAFKSYCKNDKFQHVEEDIYGGESQIERFPFSHQHEQDKFFPIRVSEYRLFTGINPTIKKDDLRFDSDFQGGNLDLAIYINPVEYDLLMRVDSNTKGHTAWFFFKVNGAVPNQKIKFNIVNFGKKYLLYKDGMKPYSYRKSKGKWTQEGISVSYQKRRFRYEGSEHVVSHNLSFFYEFKDYEPVYFAYCIPYSYSYLLHRLNSLNQKYSRHMKISYKSQSTGGLAIPLVTITNFSTNDDRKENILCTGRMHPGESQGSWMMDGFIQFLLSNDSFYLRDRAVIKIIPMVNVDGVVLGNFRTGIMGRDLNRCFSNQQSYAQIQMIKKLASQFNPGIYLDFHGHSAKRNVFIYGPDYKLEDKLYLSSRVFPKLISKLTPAFRYYSCIFKISSSKRTTGRAVMLRDQHVKFSYTVQASTHCHGSKSNQVDFTIKQYMAMGQKIGMSLIQFIKFLKVLPKRQQLKLEKQEKGKNRSKKDINSKLDFKKFLEQEGLSEDAKKIIEEIIKQDENSEKDSEGEGSDSDCEDDQDDYNKRELNDIFQCKFDSHVAKPEIKKKKVKKVSKGQRSPKFSKPLNEQTISPPKDYLQSNKNSLKSKITQKKVKQNSQTIELRRNSRNYVSFEPKKEQLLRNNPNYMNNIIKKYRDNHSVPRIQSECKQVLESFNSEERKNNVHYDWNNKQQQLSVFNHFNFQTSETSKQIRENQKEEKTEKKKKMPILSIKKSVLPMVGRKNQKDEVSNQKSMLSQILQQHERKKKLHRNVRIMFL